MKKELILNEIKRTALANGGDPLGWRRFATETGIRECDWKGKFWARWSDAVREAGFAPNEMREAHSELFLLNVYAKLALELGSLPTPADMRLAVRNGLEFPDWSTFRRQFGGKAQLVASLKKYCREHAIYSPLVELCDAYTPRGRAQIDSRDSVTIAEGFVYMIKHGARREYRIGCTYDPLRREGEIKVQLPERVAPVHVIRTDDPYGIESYWHRRFADKRKNGDWFELTREEVAAFKRRKFM